MFFKCLPIGYKRSGACLHDTVLTSPRYRVNLIRDSEVKRPQLDKWELSAQPIGNFVLIIALYDLYIL